MFNKRVVVTGLGLVTPLGNTVASNWAKLLGSQHGIVNLDHYYASKKESLKGSKNKSELERLEELNLPQKSNSRIGGVVDFDATGLEGLLDDRLMPKFIKYGVSAAHQALTDSSWFPKSEDDCLNTGVCFGSGIGSLMDTVNTYKHLDNGNYNKVSPFFVPRILVNMAAGHITIKYGFRGPNHSVSTACTTGAHSIGDAYRFILHGDAKVMVAGGSESSLNPLSYAGFGRAKSLSTSFNDAPGQASRPFDSKRDGFVVGEGAGAIVLEELEHAKQRGARIYAEIKGYGLSGDAHHITSPPDDARGAYRAMQRALETAKLNPEQIGYINAHATSTPKGDALERLAIERLFASSAHLRDQKLAVSSSKGAIGHLLGAAGAVESIYTILALYNGVLPPTLNLENPEPSQAGMEINLVPKTSQNANIKYALSNSFGFGGTNASLCFGKFE